MFLELGLLVLGFKVQIPLRVGFFLGVGGGVWGRMG